jgi:phosphate-selective porin
MDQNQTRTLSVSWYGKAMYQISNEYLKARRKKVRKTDFFALTDRRTDGQTDRVQTYSPLRLRR